MVRWRILFLMIVFTWDQQHITASEDSAHSSPSFSCVPWSVRQRGPTCEMHLFYQDVVGGAAWAPITSGVLDCQGLNKTIYVFWLYFYKLDMLIWNSFLEAALLNALDVSDSTPAIDWMSVSSPSSHSYVEIWSLKWWY